MEAICFLSSFCNLRCKHCFGAFGVMRQNEAQLDEWMGYLNTLNDGGVDKVILTGGEPALLPYAPHLTTYALHLFKHVTFQTNGTVVNKLLLDFLNEYYPKDPRMSFAVSIEDINEEKNDEIRSQYSFKLASLAARTYKKEGYDVWVRTTIFDDNDVIGVRNLAASWGVNHVGVRFLPTGYGKQIANRIPNPKKLLILYKSYADLDGKMKTTATLEDPQYYIYNEELLHKKLGSGETAMEYFGRKGRICPAAQKRIVIDAFGDVYACHMYLGIKEKPFYFGNISDGPQIIQKGMEEFNKWRKAQPILETCASCEFFPVCGGGCTWYQRVNGKIGDPYCPIYEMKKT